MRRIGIIGGMGPAATIDLFTKIVQLTPASKDQEHIPILIDCYPQIEDRTSFLIKGTQSPLPKLLESAIRLKKGGAEALIMPCNTAHYFADSIRECVDLPLLHIVECSADAIKKNYPSATNIGVVATIGTRVGRVYEDILEKYGLNIIKFDKELEDDIMACIYDGVKAGKTKEYAPLFATCVDRVAAAGADIMIAGCTEIPLLLEHVAPEIPVVDATFELANAAVLFALDGENREKDR